MTGMGSKVLRVYQAVLLGFFRSLTETVLSLKAKQVLLTETVLSLKAKQVLLARPREDD